MNFSWIDYAILLVLLLSILVGLVRGFTRESLSLICWILAFWVGFSFAEYPAAWFVSSIESEMARQVVGFFILFLVVIMLGGFANAFISRGVERIGLGGTDRLLGVGFGFIRGVLIVGLLLLLGEVVAFQQTPAWQKSLLVPRFQPFVVWLESLLPSDFTPSKMREE